MSYINLLANDVWSEADILSHGRALIDAQVSALRRSELQTIMLGHMAGIRTATADEFVEIGTVRVVTEQIAALNAQSRADMALLLEVMAFEADPIDKTLSVEAQAVYDSRHPSTDTNVQPQL